MNEPSPVNLLFLFYLLRCSVSQLIWHQRQEGEKGEEGEEEEGWEGREEGERGGMLGDNIGQGIDH